MVSVVTLLVSEVILIVSEVTLIVSKVTDIILPFRSFYEVNSKNENLLFLFCTRVRQTFWPGSVCIAYFYS